MEETTDEIQRLQVSINDLISVFAIPAVWSGREPAQIASALLDVLLRLLRLDFAYARLEDPLGGAPIEVARVGQYRELTPLPQEIGQALHPWLENDPKNWPLLVRNPIGEGDVSIVPLRLGLQNRMGIIVAGAQRADFPGEIERLLLRIAANQATIALQEARDHDELKALATARTGELARANESLHRSETYLADAQKLSHTGSWAFNVTTREIVHWSQEHFRIFGFDPENGTPSFETLMQRIHPDDRASAAEVIERGVRDRTDYEQDFRIVLPDGTTRYVHAIGHPVFNSSGDLVEFMGTVVDVTESNRAEEKARRSEASLLYAQRLSRTGSWSHNFLSGTVTTSPETLRMWGIQSEDTGVTPDFYFARMHPEDRPRVEQAYKEAQLKKSEFESDFRIVLPNGTIRNIHSIGRPIMNESGEIVEFIGASIDITERKRAEQRLILQHTVTQMLAEAITFEEVAPKILQTVCEFLLWEVGVLWRVDAEAGVLRCVEVWHRESVKIPQFEAICCQSTFMPGIGLPGRLWSSHEPAYIPDVVHDANFPRASVARSEGLHAAFGFPIMLGGDVVGVMEFFVRERRQSEHELLSTMAILGSQIGQFIEGKRAEEKLRKSQADLAHVTRVATLGEMSASIAHEVNQPLTAAVTSASACLRWLDAQKLEDARRSASRVIAEVHRASEIIGRIRSLTKKAPPQKGWLNVNETIHEVIAFARSEIQRNNITLETRLSEQVPAILADRVQLQQVILNLMMNAIEAMNGVGEGPRELLIRSGTDESKQVVISVQDSGPGIDPGNLDHLFEAFYTTKPQGLGMGLAISRSIVESHGGRLWTISNDGPGVTFQFTLHAASK